MAKQQRENPLLSRNIPPPPPAESSTETPTPSSLEVKNEITVSGQNGISASPARASTQIPAEQGEKATIELSLYLRPSQDDKLEDLRRAYKKRTKKKISANEVMRRLIEKATLDDLLTDADLL